MNCGDRREPVFKDDADRKRLVIGADEGTNGRTSLWGRTVPERTGTGRGDGPGRIEAIGVEGSRPGNPTQGRQGKTEAGAPLASGNDRDREMDRPAAANGGLDAPQPPVILTAAQNGSMKCRNTTILRTDPFTTNLNQPAAVASVDDLMTERFYVADTGNNRVALYGVVQNDPTPVWNGMINRVAAGDISGAALSFCGDSADNYRQAFLNIGTNDLASDMSQIGTLTPVFIKDDSAEYYFEKTIEGHPILFTVEFMKENGAWKIVSF